MEARQRLEGLVDALGTELACGRDRASEAAQHLLVEERGGCPHGSLVDDEAHGVRADIDDTERLEVL